MFSSSEIKKSALSGMKEQLGKTIFAAFLYLVVTNVLGLIQNISQLVYLLVALFLISPLIVSYANYFLQTARHQKPRSLIILDIFKNYLPNLALSLLATLKLTGWVIIYMSLPVILLSTISMSQNIFVLAISIILFIIAFALLIRKSFQYTLAVYIINDDPAFGASASIKRSIKLMKSNIFRFLKLNLSFIAWFIPSFIAIVLTMITLTQVVFLNSSQYFMQNLYDVNQAAYALYQIFNLAIKLPMFWATAALYLVTFLISLFVTPYMQTSFAVFYNELIAKENQDNQPTNTIVSDANSIILSKNENN